MKYLISLTIIGVSLLALAQVPVMPDASGLMSGRRAPAFRLVILQPIPFEFRGIRIGDEMQEAKRKFLALKIPSLSSRPGLCGSDGVKRSTQPDVPGYPEVIGDLQSDATVRDPTRDAGRVVVRPVDADHASLPDTIGEISYAGV